jgi:hypothetical protein
MNKVEKSQLRAVTQSPSWITFEKFAELVIQKIRSNSVIKETNDQTIQELFLQEGKVRGIQEFFQELINLSNDNE